MHRTAPHPTPLPTRINQKRNSFPIKTVINVYSEIYFCIFFFFFMAQTCGLYDFDQTLQLTDVLFKTVTTLRERDTSARWLNWTSCNHNCNNLSVKHCRCYISHFLCGGFSLPLVTWCVRSFPFSISFQHVESLMKSNIVFNPNLVTSAMTLVPVISLKWNQ